jgi:hypothetical protein
MEKINDGGPAFPYDEIVGIPGMSLRQLYALGAMIGFISNPNMRVTDTSISSEEAISQAAFKLADAMIAEEKNNGPQS